MAATTPLGWPRRGGVAMGAGMRSMIAPIVAANKSIFSRDAARSLPSWGLVRLIAGVCGLLPPANRIVLAKPFKRAILFSKPPRGLVSYRPANRLIYDRSKCYGTR